MNKVTQPPAGKTPDTFRGVLQRGWALLWSVLIALFARISRRQIPAPIASVPAAPASCDDIEFARPVERPRNALSRNRTYSHLIVDDLVGKVRKQREKIAFLTNVFRSTGDAVIVAELSGSIVMFNEGAEAIFQLEKDLAVGDNLFRLCTDSEPDGPRISRMLVENKRIENMRVELTGIRGKRTPCLLTLNFVEDEDGAAVAIVAVIKDNSVLENLFTEVTRKKEEVERLLVEVEKLSVTDEKTGMYNSRYFQQKITDEYERMKRGHMDALSLIVIDVDHFKRFNDTYGHQTGDLVLKMVADVTKRTVRKIDVPCRFGGEEFMVILPATGEQGAWKLAERIREAIAELKVPVKGDKEVGVTVSIGVRTHRPADSTVGMFIHEADEAMYRAKQTGRNRTCAFEKIAA